MGIKTNNFLTCEAIVGSTGLSGSVGFCHCFVLPIGRSLGEAGIFRRWAAAFRSLQVTMLDLLQMQKFLFCVDFLGFLKTKSRPLVFDAFIW